MGKTTKPKKDSEDDSTKINPNPGDLESEESIQEMLEKDMHGDEHEGDGDEYYTRLEDK